MSIKMNVRERAGVEIVDLRGQLLMGEGPEEMKALVMGLIDQAKSGVLVNLAKVSKVDTTGLGALINCHLSATKRGVRIALAGPAARIKDLLVITKLLTVFEVFDDEDAAITGFQAPRDGVTVSAK